MQKKTELQKYKTGILHKNVYNESKKGANSLVLCIFTKVLSMPELALN